MIMRDWRSRLAEKEAEQKEEAKEEGAEEEQEKRRKEEEEGTTLNHRNCNKHRKLNANVDGAPFNAETPVAKKELHNTHEVLVVFTACINVTRFAVPSACLSRSLVRFD